MVALNLLSDGRVQLGQALSDTATASTLHLTELLLQRSELSAQVSALLYWEVVYKIKIAEIGKRSVCYL